MFGLKLGMVLEAGVDRKVRRRYTLHMYQYPKRCWLYVHSSLGMVPSVFVGLDGQVIDIVEKVAKSSQMVGSKMCWPTID